MNATVLKHYTGWDTAVILSNASGIPCYHIGHCVINCAYSVFGTGHMAFAILQDAETGAYVQALGGGA